MYFLLSKSLSCSEKVPSPQDAQIVQTSAARVEIVFPRSPICNRENWRDPCVPGSREPPLCPASGPRASISLSTARFPGFRTEGCKTPSRPPQFCRKPSSFSVKYHPHLWFSSLAAASNVKWNSASNCSNNARGVSQQLLSLENITSVFIIFLTPPHSPSAAPWS